jgi:thiamine kinase-like enzyme
VSVLEREPFDRGTFPSEIVTCQVDGREKLRLFCKYAADSAHPSHGHRGGVAYEAAIYRHVLEPLSLTAARSYGASGDEAPEAGWLLLEYLDDAVRLDKSEEPDALFLAARWIGKFHAASEANPAHAARSFLKTYDAEYYSGWVRRTLRFAHGMHEDMHWLAPLCKNAEMFLTDTLITTQTLIHGEYYPKNILVRGRQIYPVDWESAAIAMGEIDLATLTEGWDFETAQKCGREYRRARWPRGGPPGFERTLSAARLYLFFRWLGDRPEWTTSSDAQEWFDELRSAGERLGLLP